MPFSEFRFLNGSNNAGAADVVVADTLLGTSSMLPTPALPERRADAPLPPPPAPPPNANQIQAANVITTGGPLTLSPGTVVDAPAGEHFVRVSIVLSDNPAMGHPPRAVVIGETNTGHVVAGSLV